MRITLVLSMLAMAVALPAGAQRARPVAVPITALEKDLVAGDREPALPEAAKRAFLDAGIDRPTFIVKLCVDVKGAPTKVEMAKSEAVAEANDVILAKVREWRFRPYVKDGAAVAVCTAVMFRYVLKAPS